jgi:hypothetical protein
MEKSRSRFRRPDADEQEILNGLLIRLITLEETAKFHKLVAEHHYLKSPVLVGERSALPEAWAGVEALRAPRCTRSTRRRGRSSLKGEAATGASKANFTAA